MHIWIDAQLPPSLAVWLRHTFRVDARHVEALGLLRATDEHIFRSAREAKALVITKDADFVRLLEVHGPPPRVLWITFGNTNNSELQRRLEQHWVWASEQFEAGEPLVEIGR